MTAKEYLEQARTLDMEINSKLEMVSSLRAMAERTTSALSRAVVSRSRDDHQMEETIAKIVDLEREVNEDIDRLVELKREIMGVIKKLDDPVDRYLLSMRYICGKDWEEIADAMNYHIRTIYKVHDRAIQKMENLLERIKLHVDSERRA